MTATRVAPARCCHLEMLGRGFDKLPLSSKGLSPTFWECLVGNTSIFSVLLVKAWKSGDSKCFGLINCSTKSD